MKARKTAHHIASDRHPDKPIIFACEAYDTIECIAIGVYRGVLPLYLDLRENVLSGDEALQVYLNKSFIFGADCYKSNINKFNF